MNLKKKFSTTFVSLFLLVSFWISAEGATSRPIAVSPGSNTEVTTVWQSCPTFSWSAFDQAASYRITVFEVVDPKVMDYEEMAAMTLPVITKDIPGPALSYTLSSAESLKTGNMYTWYVQALDAYGNALGDWSNGKAFKVEQEVRFAGIEEKLAEKLREYGVNKEVITDVLKDIKSGVKEVVLKNDYPKYTQGLTGVKGTEGPNTYYGVGAGASNTTGYWDTFIGFDAGNANTTGYQNTFVGDAAGAYNIGGYSNTLIGMYAGIKNTNGFANTFLGQAAGYSNTTGNINTFLGQAAGYSNKTGDGNTFVGYNAGYKNTTGQSNIFMGVWTGYNNTTGAANIMVGNYAGYRNTDGSSNTFVGNRAGYDNTSGSGNTFSGNLAGVVNTTGCENTFIGYWAGKSNTEGNNNTFLGNYAGLSNTTGIGNVFLGSQAGYIETGSNKLYIDNSDTNSPLIYGEFDNNIVTVNGKLGIGTKTPGWPMELETTGSNACFVVDRTDGATNYINATASFGNFGTVTNHPLRLVVNSTWKMMINPDGSLSMSNGATCTAGGAWLSASSRDLKENIDSLSTGEALDVLNKLNPVKYNYKVDKEDKYVGFIAEDVPELVATADRKGLSAMDISAVLTRVVQEQQKMIRNQQQVNRDYKKIISDLQERIAKIESEK
ncbi:MAG: tail fiber domain-containing protein [Candidatus Aminicenantes bacterium]|nr:tail fiber domain-containing protein [Candidatus Aminicenantes bacterium]